MILYDQAGAAAHTARILAAPPGLQAFVEHVWTQQRVAASSDHAWRIVPDANPYLIFSVARTALGTTRARCALVGPRSRFLDISVTDRVFTCGFRLRPGVLPLLTRSAATALTDRALAVDDAFGARGKRLMDMLGASASLRVACRRVAEFLERELAGRSFQPLPVRGVASVHELVDATGWSARTLRQRVTRQIGLSPKRCLRIERIHRAMACCNRHDLAWSDIATHCGFADQAHMVREFVDLLGDTPTAWIRRAPSSLSPEAVTRHEQQHARPDNGRARCHQSQSSADFFNTALPLWA